MSKKPTVLMILDGYGLNDKHEGNAIYEAKTPVMDKLMAEYPFVKGNASGLAVGLPDGQMGNSEVGHMNMGAGRIVYQELTRITKEINDGDFFKNEALLAAMKNAKENDSAIHFMGLLSDGGVHSHNTHLYALLEMAKREGLEKVYVHCFLDGRDTPPASGKEFIEQLEAKMKEIGVGQIGVVSGRYYAMDRDNRWDRVELAYKALTEGEGVKGTDAAAAVQASYDNDKTDEFVLPTVIEKDGQPVAKIQDKDSVVFFNFRPDRAREITRAFCDDEFKGFERAKKLDLTYVCFTDYDETIQNKQVAFHKVLLKNTFGEYLAAHDMTQVRIAETEKYAHVTFFFNGGVEEPNKGEDRILVKSPKVATYDLKIDFGTRNIRLAQTELHGLALQEAFGLLPVFAALLAKSRVLRHKVKGRRQRALALLFAACRGPGRHGGRRVKQQGIASARHRSPHLSQQPVEHAPHKAGQRPKRDDRPCDTENPRAYTGHPALGLEFNRWADDGVCKPCNGHQRPRARLGGQLLVPARQCENGGQKNQRNARQRARQRFVVPNQKKLPQCLAEGADGPADQKRPRAVPHHGRRRRRAADHLIILPGIQFHISFLPFWG